MKGSPFFSGFLEKLFSFFLFWFPPKPFPLSRSFFSLSNSFPQFSFQCLSLTFYPSRQSDFSLRFSAVTPSLVSFFRRHNSQISIPYSHSAVLSLSRQPFSPFLSTSPPSELSRPVYLTPPPTLSSSLVPFFYQPSSRFSLFRFSAVTRCSPFFLLNLAATSISSLH